ncbi:hypothetical protein [Nocardioides sp. CER19]|uniref:hypothetical protein n=1 Tax=Nocardioides sp. CER19 TaxID=3038538 RepID=UPI002449440B|nr:hypothetical protein [Nocardioides sp. CER19]MDH2413947.1 hypothetical protein [Nocardioides sp. CER19]
MTHAVRDILGGEVDDETLREHARERTARERLNRIEELRDVAFLRSKNLPQRAIAERLGTTQPRVLRMLRALDIKESSGEPRETPEEIILRTVVEHADRGMMVKRLKAFTYTVGEYAPYPAEGKTRGTWEQVVDAHREGYLTRGEFEEIRSAAGL